MNSNLGELYRQFTTRPKEMTAWEMEDWMDEKSKKTGRGYYIPKGEIFYVKTRKDSRLRHFYITTKENMWLNIMHRLLAPVEEAERAMKCFEKQVLQVLRANNINENGTWDELTDMIENYELREKKLKSKKATQIEQSDNASGATEQHDPALLSMKRPRADASSTTSGENAKGAKSIAAMGKTTEMQT
ncbi:hypothetical protein BCON_0312g00050 [Botryotinia convoluta]|uniref:Uncharacterized protein n=1 Tax=Botryotinia convoluta TaxID=54673 RepID=A0A4Z1HC52_9HELO|nr:hypothetical protein BCON_0312g00050 [Botryotinia convoluta]